ncbi:MAG: hypothetical protein JWQ66_1608, partial [Mucilaginibacter sp.]|nr:hypothetical protein [Mucilaginibacter sp.]
LGINPQRNIGWLAYLQIKMGEKRILLFLLFGWGADTPIFFCVDI